MHLLAAAVAFVLTGSLLANNIQVTNYSLVNLNEGEGHVDVLFDLTWEHSWRTSAAPNNWDAAWVFVKYQKSMGSLLDWRHARLGHDGEHVAPAGTTIETGLLTPGAPFDASTNYGVGAFVYRSADGTGTFSATNMQLRWNYGTIPFGEIVQIEVFAVEMVSVPQGAFWVGDGASGFKNGTTSDPYQITSEAELELADSDGSLWSTDGVDVETATLPAAFPKGYAAFYCMKYEITQQQYVDFLNTLSRGQQVFRVGSISSPTQTVVYGRYVKSGTVDKEHRNGIRCDSLIIASAPVTFYCDMNGNGIGSEAGDGQWVACNYIDWADLTKYLEWSGLRPMTELEYEKVCRGPLPPVWGERAWGFGTEVYENASYVVNGGFSNEMDYYGDANCVCDGDLDNLFQGPLRVGIFAGDTTSRGHAGAGYYGALELTGNLVEQVVGVGHAEGRAFTGVHGNGVESILNGQNVDGDLLWPAYENNGNGSIVGAGTRGGGWGSWSYRVSHRGFGSGISAWFDPAAGGRGVRSAP